MKLQLASMAALIVAFAGMMSSGTASAGGADPARQHNPLRTV
ncbi:hypothetical protein N7676_05555 [Stenotrophomonas sp. GD03993]|nr:MULTISPECIES: hypothetical protein [unclassified Stenotrophomonas]MDH0187555.1 hypothetical protein [Stenotrophomonas sp. GD04051]MDH0463267.1 hypothetical protein [Stenotrophomonas sp. GD03993]MDH0876136.1 hypothetical protein [Stenotrophomonas sp. GD03877]MDH2156302.1 hypothetical protein [Stenotrophomonas sp. GD03657]